jgi:CheY-like chemotaxis protein
MRFLPFVQEFAQDDTFLVPALPGQEVTAMKQTPEEANRAAVWKSLMIFLEGSASLNWIVDAIESSGVRGSDLAEIIESLRGHGNAELRRTIFTACRKKGWIESPESAPPLAMIIEDHEDAATIFANALRGTGFEIEVIQTGDVALKRLAETTPAVVILDLHLPRVSGAEILRQIRASARLAGIYVIVATAYPDMAMGLDAKADQTFLKPVSFVQLQDLALRLGLKYAGGVDQAEVPVSD